jgi:hypothetical protein
MFRKTIALILAVALIGVGFTAQVSAAVITTQQTLSVESRQLLVSEVQAKLAREEVRQTMVELGVDPEQAQLRVASLSDQELARLDGQLDSLPAGGGALALIGAVFVVLLILELTGIIDIFKRT